MKKLAVYLLILLMHSCCGYHFEPCSPSSCKTTVSVPYICGDTLGVFTDELIHALCASGRYVYQREEGELELIVKIVSEPTEKIGYKFDKEGKIGKSLKNLVGVEERIEVAAEVSLTNTCTGECLIAPEIVKAYADYDYVDYNSIKDLSVKVGGKQTVSSVAYSLGQLDTVDGAKFDVLYPVYRDLSNKIVLALLAHTCR